MKIHYYLNYEYIDEENKVVGTTVSSENPEWAVALQEKVNTKITASAKELGLDITTDDEGAYSLMRQLEAFKAKYPEKSIWAFSGYLFDRDILPGRLGDPEITREYLGYLDVLVDGPFIEAQKNLSLRFRGSANQRLIDVPKSLASGTVVLWEDWQGNGRGLK